MPSVTRKVLVGREKFITYFDGQTPIGYICKPYLAVNYGFVKTLTGAEQRLFDQMVAKAKKRDGIQKVVYLWGTLELSDYKSHPLRMVQELSDIEPTMAMALRRIIRKEAIVSDLHFGILDSFTSKVTYPTPVFNSVVGYSGPKQDESTLSFFQSKLSTFEGHEYLGFQKVDYRVNGDFNAVTMDAAQELVRIPSNTPSYLEDGLSKLDESKNDRPLEGKILHLNR